jgi:hypothetical protein
VLLAHGKTAGRRLKSCREKSVDRLNPTTFQRALSMCEAAMHCSPRATGPTRRIFSRAGRACPIPSQKHARTARSSRRRALHAAGGGPPRLAANPGQTRRRPPRVRCRLRSRPRPRRRLPGRDDVRRALPHALLLSVRCTRTGSIPPPAPRFAYVDRWTAALRALIGAGSLPIPKKSGCCGAYS